jgi:predicted nucleotidyltransferase
MLDDITVRLKAWAPTKPNILKIYLYGSRVRGNHKKDSDLDIAIMITKNPNDTSELATWWGGLEEEFTQDIEIMTELKIDLELYSNEQITANIHEYLKNDSRLVYEKK